MNRISTSSRHLPTRCAAMLLLSDLTVAGCGGSGLSPTTSGAITPVIASDFSGSWVQVDGGGRTWNLTAGASQFGLTPVIQIVGPSTISQDNHPSFGPMSAHGGVLGTMVVGFGGLHFAETYEGVSTPLFPFPPNDCYIDTEGELTLSGGTMTGVVTEHDGCNGVRVRDFTSKLIMQRK